LSRTRSCLPPGSALDQFLTGKERYKHDDWAAAIPHFDAALQRQPGHFWAYCLSAICSIQLGRPIEDLGQVYLQQNKSDHAVEQFTRAISLLPDSAPLYRARAAANLDRNESTPAHRARAAADLDQAIRLEPPTSPTLALDHTRRVG